MCCRDQSVARRDGTVRATVAGCCRSACLTACQYSYRFDTKSEGSDLLVSGRGVRVGSRRFFVSAQAVFEENAAWLKKHLPMYIVDGTRIIYVAESYNAMLPHFQGI